MLAEAMSSSFRSCSRPNTRIRLKAFQQWSKCYALPSCHALPVTRDLNISSIETRSQMKQEDPLNLSILLGGGKETNKNSPSNGE